MPQTIADCRVYERHSCQVPTSCQPAAAAELRWDCTIEDVSQSGLRLRLGRRFEPRTGLGIELPGKCGEESVTVYVRVVHVRRDEDGTYVLGCRFMSELSDEELHRLVGFGSEGEHTFPAMLPLELERQRIADVCVWIGIGPDRIARCRVKQLYVAGSWPVAVGTALTLRGVAMDGRALEHTFEVIQCGQDGEGWSLKVLPLDPASSPAWLR